MLEPSLSKINGSKIFSGTNKVILLLSFTLIKVLTSPTSQAFLYSIMALPGCTNSTILKHNTHFTLFGIYQKVVVYVCVPINHMAAQTVIIPLVYTFCLYQKGDTNLHKMMMTWVQIHVTETVFDKNYNIKTQKQSKS